MFKRMKIFWRQSDVALILMETLGISRDQALSLIKLGKLSGFTRILDSDVLNNHERASILLKSFEETSKVLERELQAGEHGGEMKNWMVESAANRNSICSCGSGHRYKHCCGKLA